MPMARHLFIVSRQTPYIADYMREQFSEQPEVAVILDRRVRDRRSGGEPAHVDRRAGDRRQRPEIDTQLRTSFHAFVTLA
jgi:hypothetical protein